MDYKKVDRIADRIKNPVKSKEDKLIKVYKKNSNQAIFEKKSKVAKNPGKYTPVEGNIEKMLKISDARKKAIAIAKSKEPGSRVSVPDIERAMQSVQGKRKGGLTGGQKKLDKNKDGKITGEDFKMMKNNKPKKAALGALMIGKKMKDEDKKMPIAGVAAMMKKDAMKKILGRSKGGESKSDKVKRAFPKKSPEGRAKIETMLGSKYTPMKKERLFAGSAARRKEGFKKLLKNVRKAIPGVGMLDVKVTKKSKGGGADTGKRGELRSKIAVAMDRAKKRMGSRPGSSGADTRRKRKTPERPRGLGKLGGSKSKQDILFTTDKSFLKDMKPPTGAHPGKFNKGGGADMGTKMSDKRKRRFKEILERLKTPRTINIKKEFKSGTSNPMQRDRKREGYRAKVESKGGKVMFADEIGMKKFKNFMGGGMMNKPMGYKKGASIMARGCKLGRKKTTKLY